MEDQRYEVIRVLGTGNFAVTKLAKNTKTGELVAIKYIERGDKIDENVEREILNHRSLSHPHVINFKELFVTPTHLAIVLEYANRGELFHMVASHYNGRIREYEARYFFRQLIFGVEYIHSMNICHRDLKLENTLLHGNPLAPQVKICDFGFSKSTLLHSRPKSMVGTPAYFAPEILFRQEYDGKAADVWACGVMLYAMIIGTYPFQDPEDPKNFRKIIKKIMDGWYTIPDYVSEDCKHLLTSIFVANPAERITISEIQQHSWFKRYFPMTIVETGRKYYQAKATKNDEIPKQQSLEEIMQMIQEAKTKPRLDSSDDVADVDGNHVEEEAVDVINGDFVKVELV